MATNNLSAQQNFLNQLKKGRLTQSQIQAGQRYADNSMPGYNFDSKLGYYKGTKPSSSPSSAQRSAQRKAKSAATGNTISKGGAAGLAGALGQYDTLEEKALMAKMMFNSGSLTDAEKERLGLKEIGKYYDNVPSGGVFDMVAEGRDPSKQYYSDGTYAGQVLSTTVPSQAMGGQTSITSGLEGLSGPQMDSPFNTGNFDKRQESTVGYRANGGPVEAGQPYIVGERGPELIYPSQDGNVLSNEMLQIAREFGIDPTGLSEDDLYQLLSAQSAKVPTQDGTMIGAQPFTPTQPQAPASDGPQIPKFGEEGFQFAERGSPQDFFLSQTNGGTTAFGPVDPNVQTAQGVNGTMNQQALLPEGLTASSPIPEGLVKAIGSDGKMVLTSPAEAARLNAIESRIQAEDRAAQQKFLASDKAKEFSNRQIRSSIMGDGQYGRDSAAREQRQAARPDFFEAQTRAVGTVTDRDRRGTMSMADATQLTGGDRGAARALLKRQELGLGGFEPDTPSPSDVLARDKFEASQAAGGDGPSTAQQRLDFDKEKYAALVAKEAAGTPLTPSEQLARERFEFDQQQAAAGPAKSVMDRNIERLMEATPDMSFSKAVNIAQGVISKTVDPTSGNIQTTNIATGTSTPVKSTAPLPSSTLDLDPIEPGTSLFERGQKFTGAIESGLRGAQRVVGQFGGKIASDESQQTKKELDAFQGSLVRAFQENDKFSIGQDKVLRDELDATLGAMKDPETFKNNAIALDKVMRQRHADLMENHRTLSFKDDFRSDSLSKARVLETAIRDLGVTQEDPEAPAVEAPPEGINQEAAALWEFMDEAGRASFQPKKKDELFGFPMRDELFQGEDDFFKGRPEVAGMADFEDGSIILNPYSPLDEESLSAVAKNEALRLKMHRDEFIPDIKITPEQRRFFKGTEYETNPQAMKQTILARIYSGDPSANATRDQKDALQEYLNK